MRYRHLPPALLALMACGTLSCASRREQTEWRLVHGRLDEGTHAVQVSGREEPPALIYRDAAGRLLAVVGVD